MSKKIKWIRFIPYLGGFAAILWGYYKMMKKEVETKAYVVFFLKSALLFALSNIPRFISLWFLHWYYIGILELLFLLVYIALGYVYNELLMAKATKLSNK